MYERIDRIIDALRDKWKENPDLRLFQMLHNMQVEYSVQNNNFGAVQSNPSPFVLYDFFYLKDEDFEKFLDKGELDGK